MCLALRKLESVSLTSLGDNHACWREHKKCSASEGFLVVCYLLSDASTFVLQYD